MAWDTLTGKTIFGMKVGDELKKDPQVPWTKIIVHQDQNRRHEMG
jgi:hypothetical protein